MTLSAVVLGCVVVSASAASAEGFDSWSTEKMTLYWFSNVFLGFAGIVFLLGGLPLIFDGAALAAMFGGIDPALKDIKTKAQAYEAMANCDNPVVKHLCFWFCLMLRSMGCFQAAAGVGLWLVIILVPIQHRAAAHFTLALLDNLENIPELSVGFGLPVGVDQVVKFGGAKPGVAPEPESGSSGMIRPNLKGGFIQHLVLALIHWTLGALTFIV